MSWNQEKSLHLVTKNGLSVLKFREMMKTLMKHGETLLDIIIDPASSYQDQSVLEIYMAADNVDLIMTAGQLLFTLESIMELFLTHGCPDLQTESIYSKLSQTNIMKFNNCGVLTGVLETEFLDLQDENIIKQLTDFDDSLGSWITNSVFLLSNRNGLRRGNNSAITAGFASLPISNQNAQVEYVFQRMRTIGTWTDALEYARKHRYLLKTNEVDRVVMTSTFGLHINQLRAYVYSARRNEIPAVITESYLREIGGFGLNSVTIKAELSNMAAYLENKINLQITDISTKLNAIRVTPKLVAATEEGYVNHSLDILDLPDDN